uniref:Rhodopsin domain-containing protein n=1 Tax=Moniliophthora roreri TaxID=221103 RepID=A0A0W0F6K7_MONRR
MSAKPSHPFNTKTGQAVITTVHSIAIAFTVYRIIHRVRIRRFSWDDGWATVALVFESIYLTADWLNVLVAANKNSVPVEQIRYYQKIIMWMLTSLFTMIVWTCRISLALSIARILPPGHIRTFTVIFSASCFLQGALLIIIKSITCTIDFGRVPAVKCTSGKSVGIIQVFMDVISTFILVVLPLYVLWNWKSKTDRPRRERRLVMLLFTASLLTLVVCLVHVVHNLQNDNFKQAYSAQLESAIPLLVCNLLVVGTSIYRIIYRRKHHDEDAGPDTSSEAAYPYPSLDPQSVSARDTRSAPAPFTTRLSATNMYTLSSDINSSNVAERIKIDDSSFTGLSCNPDSDPRP